MPSKIMCIKSMVPFAQFIWLDSFDLPVCLCSNFSCLIHIRHEGNYCAINPPFITHLFNWLFYISFLVKKHTRVLASSNSLQNVPKVMLQGNNHKCSNCWPLISKHFCIWQTHTWTCLKTLALILECSILIYCFNSLIFTKMSRDD
jgi:hypothetical protein